MRRGLVGALLLVATAPPPAPVLAPGQWQRGEPAAPAGASACLAAADAAAPGRWLLGEAGVGCEIDREDYAGGRVAIHATCPAPGKERPGSLTATGGWTRDHVRVRYAATSHGGGQTFTLAGAIDARRTGPCAP